MEARKTKPDSKAASIALLADLNQDGVPEGFFCTSEYGWDCFVAETASGTVKLYPQDISVQVGKASLNPVLFSYKGGVYLMAVGSAALGEGWASWVDVVRFDGTSFVTERPVEVDE